MTTTTLLQRSRALRRLTVGAAALTLLAAGCAGTTSASDDSTPADGADTQAEEPADSSDAGAADTPTTDAEDDQGEGDQGDDDQGGDGQGEDDSDGDGSSGVDARWPARLPKGWTGTISAEPIEPSGGVAYIVLTPLYETYDLTEITAEEIEGSEFVSAQRGSCEGSAILDGQAATCALVADIEAGDAGDPSAPAEVLLVHGPYGNPSILTSVDAEGLTSLPVAPTTPLGLGRVEPYLLEDVTAADVEGALREGVLEVGVDPVDIPRDVSVECEVVDDGLHALCEISGGIQDGVDGFWYATAQPGPSMSPYDGQWYLFSQFPDE